MVVAVVMKEGVGEERSKPYKKPLRNLFLGKVRF